MNYVGDSLHAAVSAANLIRDSSNCPAVMCVKDRISEIITTLLMIRTKTNDVFILGVALTCADESYCISIYYNIQPSGTIVDSSLMK